MSSRIWTRAFHLSPRNYSYSNLVLTLFSKDNCGLCDKAKGVMSRVLNDNKDLKSKAEYITVNIDDPKNKEWWDKYCFDIPVLHLEDKTKKDSLLKVFHRLDEKEVIGKIETFK